jgi:hypothetical protein
MLSGSQGETLGPHGRVEPAVVAVASFCTFGWLDLDFLPARRERRINLGTFVYIINY